jgi:hypothetical protein
MFPPDECFDFSIFVKRLIGQDEYDGNTYHNKLLEGGILTNLDEIYTRMYSKMFTGKYELLSCSQSYSMKYSRMEEDDRLFEARPKEPGLSYVVASILDGMHFY